jgi:enoyl-CoA hydratase
MASAPLQISVAAPGVTVVTMDRPEKLNAMDEALVTGLHGALDEAGRDPECRVIVITGAGRGFCAGLDLGGFGSAPDTGQGAGRVQQGFAVQQHIAALIPRLRRLRQPVIAAVNGPASGGGFALVLGSDIRIAARSARFNAAFVRIGLSACDIGTSWLLPRLVGVARAQELMLTGRIFDAEEALRIGLVDEVVPAGELVDRAIALAERLGRRVKGAVAACKRAVYEGATMPLADGLRLERAEFLAALGTQEAQDAMAAYLEELERTGELPAYDPAVRERVLESGRFGA